jgi:hypothetical protein
VSATRADVTGFGLWFDVVIFSCPAVDLANGNEAMRFGRFSKKAPPSTIDRNGMRRFKHHDAQTPKAA